MNRSRLAGIGAAACIACCAAPLLLAAGGVTALGVVGTLVLGIGALAAAGVLAASLVVAHRRQRTTPAKSISVTLGPPRHPEASGPPSPR